MSSWLLIGAEEAGSARHIARCPGKLVIDLTAGTAPLARRRTQAAETVLAWRAQSARSSLWVLIESPDHGRADADLAAVVATAPDGIILSGCRSAADIQHLGSKLGVAEAEAGVADGATRIVALVGACADAPFAMGRFAGSSPRLAGLAWNEAALAGALGIEAEDAARPVPAPLALARALTVLAAHSAGVPAIDTGFGLTGEDLARACRRARQDGFTAMMTRDPVQAHVIEEIFGSAGPAET